MATRRETEIVWTYDYYIFLALPFLVSIILFVQALKEGHSGIFVDMWWVMVITFVVWFYIRVWPTRIKVNHKNETLTFFDGAFRAHSISAGTLKEITVEKSYLIYQKSLD